MPSIKKKEHEIGSNRAPVTLLEYGDFECPYCGAAHGRIEQIRRLFGERLKFVFKNFPLTSEHPHALSAARAAEAAGRQGAFWPMYDLLYRNQDSLDETELFEYADELGLDMNKFARDFRSKRILADIESDIDDGETEGVEGTPTFFINGKKFRGAWQDQGLIKAIRQALGEEEPGERPAEREKKGRKTGREIETDPAR